MVRELAGAPPMSSSDTLSPVCRLSRTEREPPFRALLPPSPAPAVLQGGVPQKNRHSSVAAKHNGVKAGFRSGLGDAASARGHAGHASPVDLAHGENEAASGGWIRIRFHRPFRARRPASRHPELRLPVSGGCPRHRRNRNRQAACGLSSFAPARRGRRPPDTWSGS